MYKIFIGVLFASSIIAQSNNYESDAREFLENHIKLVDGRPSISHEDFQYLLNLAYFSYMRSYLSLAAKEASIKNLSDSWKVDRNIAYTMRDPLHKLPYENVILDSKGLNEALEAHKNMGEIYSHAVFNFELLSDKAKVIVRNFRRFSGIVRLSSLLEAQSEIISSLKNSALKIDAAADNLKNSIDSAQSFVDNIEVAKLADVSFWTRNYIDADEMSHKISNENWEAMMSFEDSVYAVWRILETERMEFYKAYYAILNELAQKFDLPQKYKAILFDSEGIIKEDVRSEMLPEKI